jgi:hypothetical protein
MCVKKMEGTNVETVLYPGLMLLPLDRIIAEIN